MYVATYSQYIYIYIYIYMCVYVYVYDPGDQGLIPG